MIIISNAWKDLISSIYAGMAIAIAGIVNLTVGGLAGAILFGVGLLLVVNY